LRAWGLSTISLGKIPSQESRRNTSFRISIPKLSKDKAKEVLNIPKVDEFLEPVKKKKETKELEELVSPFNFERELSKTKIPMSLVELAKTPHTINKLRK
jgi:hypothetical protein